MKVNLDFKNYITPEENWTQSFQNHAEHSVDVDINTIEEPSIEIINDLMVDEIFNKVSLGQGYFDIYCGKMVAALCFFSLNTLGMKVTLINMSVE